MAAAKLKTWWDEDIFGKSVLCPECGAPLQGREVMEVVKKELGAKVEETLEAMKQETVREIRRMELQEVRKAWYHSHLGSLDFARQIGLITEERRQQLYREFQECVTFRRESKANGIWEE